MSRKGRAVSVDAIGVGGAALALFLGLGLYRKPRYILRETVDAFLNAESAGH